MEKEYYCKRCNQKVEVRVKNRWCKFNKQAMEIGRFIQKQNMRIVGESRDKKCWWIIWDGVKTRYSFTKDYIKEIK